MTTKNRIAQLEKTAPKQAAQVVNPYLDMSKAEILQLLKAEVERGEPDTAEGKEFFRQATIALANNGITWAVKHGNQ